jgi:ribosomal protein L40E
MQEIDWTAIISVYVFFGIMVLFLAYIKNRCVPCWFFGALFLSPLICSVILLFLSKLPKENEGEPIKSIDFSGERELSNDSYLIYLTKKYRIEFNSALSKFICNDKLFLTSDEAVEHAHELELKNDPVKKSSLDKNNFIICGTCSGKNGVKDSTCRYCKTDLVL